MKIGKLDSALDYIDKSIDLYTRIKGARHFKLAEPLLYKSVILSK